MKRIVNIILVLVTAASISLMSYSNAYAFGEPDKACRMIVATPDSADIVCNGAGTICSINADCIRVFNPQD